jgi:hypothetical protein
LGDASLTESSGIEIAALSGAGHGRSVVALFVVVVVVVVGVAIVVVAPRRVVVVAPASVDVVVVVVLEPVADVMRRSGRASTTPIKRRVRVVVPRVARVGTFIDTRLTPYCVGSYDSSLT